MKITTEERLARLLAMVPWIVAHNGPTVKEVCTRFELTPRDLAADIGLLYLCGLHPYTPDLLIEADIREGRVFVSYADYFSRPLRLTPVEGLGLLTAARTLLAVPGTDPLGPLATGLAKLANALGAEDVVTVDLGDASVSVTDTLREAVLTQCQAEIDYLSFAKNDRTIRIIEPAWVFTTQGQWYVSGYCHQAVEERIFRIDRIVDARLLETSRTAPPAAQPPDLFTDAPAAGLAELDLSSEDRWVIEQYPMQRVDEQPGGRMLVSLAVTDPAWLDRLCLRLHGSSRVLSGPPGWSGQPAAAAKVLAIYK
jgi:predicted DNA-binding transcriptional regulator YafY